MQQPTRPDHAGHNKHRWLLGLALLGMGALGVVLSLDPGEASVEAAALQAEEPDEIDPVVYSNVQRIRRTASLQVVDLAALGCTQQEAEAVLGRLLAWAATNAAAFASSERAVYAAERELADQKRLIRIGQATERQLSDADGLADGVTQARQAYRKLKMSAATYAMQDAPGKFSAWQDAVRLEGDIPRELRFAGSMSQQRLDHLQSEMDRLDQDLVEVLSFSEKQGMAEVRARVKANLRGVREAERDVLPRPEVLMDLGTDEPAVRD